MGVSDSEEGWACGGGLTRGGSGGGRGDSGSNDGDGGDGDGDGEGGRGEELAARGLGGVNREPFMIDQITSKQTERGSDGTADDKHSTWV